MSFSPDRTENFPPRTCPSPNNHTRRRLQNPLGAAALRRRLRGLQRSRGGLKEVDGPIRVHPFGNSKSDEEYDNGRDAPCRRRTCAPARGRSRLRSGTKITERAASN